jgi:LysR family hydrogen peroxide-inducible transcriptional activator
MELHQLRYFVALAQTGNFSRAAEVCHVTQPSLSQQIKKLEEELEEPLLVRRMNKSRTTLTEAGEILLSLAQRVLAEVEAAYRAMEDLSDLTRGSITMGVIPTIAPYFLPELISAFQDKYPQLRLELREDHTEALLAQLRAGDIHVAILSPPVAGEFVVYPLFEAEPFLLLHQDHCLSGQVEEFCVHQEVSLNTVFRSSQLETIKSMVRSGNGLSLMPEMAIDRERSNGLGYVSVKPRLARKIAIVHHRDQLLSRAVTAFLNFVQTQFGRVSESAG